MPFYVNKGHEKNNQILSSSAYTFHIRRVKVMWHSMTKEDVKRKLRTSFEQGLSDEEAKRRQTQYGENKIQEKKKTNIFIRFLLQFNDFMIIILLVAAGVSAVLSYFEGTRRIHRLNYNCWNSCV